MGSHTRHDLEAAPRVPIDLQMPVNHTPIGTKHQLKLIRDRSELSVSVILEQIGR